MKAQKWDFEYKKYKIVDISDNCSFCEMDFEKKVECPGCGKMITYGKGYTSRRYHNYTGFGYCVCVECYEKELKEDLHYIKESKNEKVRN